MPNFIQIDPGETKTFVIVKCLRQLIQWATQLTIFNLAGTQTKNTVLAGPTSGGNATPTFRALVLADLPVLPVPNLSPITNSIGVDVNPLAHSGSYSDGPSVAQGSTGTWFASGTVTLVDSGGALFKCKLWDGTTVIDSCDVNTTAGMIITVSLSGFLASPAGNLRISVLDNTSTSGIMYANVSGNGKDSTITAFRVA